jgi:hypothetical protein
MRTGNTHTPIRYLKDNIMLYTTNGSHLAVESNAATIPSNQSEIRPGQNPSRIDTERSAVAALAPRQFKQPKAVQYLFELLFVN